MFFKLFNPTDFYLFTCVHSTYFVYRGAEWQEALFDELVQGLLVLRSYL